MLDKVNKKADFGTKKSDFEVTIPDIISDFKLELKYSPTVRELELDEWKRYVEGRIEESIKESIKERPDCKKE